MLGFLQFEETFVNCKKECQFKDYDQALIPTTLSNRAV